MASYHRAKNRTISAIFKTATEQIFTFWAFAKYIKDDSTKLLSSRPAVISVSF